MKPIYTTLRHHIHRNKTSNLKIKKKKVMRMFGVYRIEEDGHVKTKTQKN
jgi:hypothetical protein